MLNPIAVAIPAFVVAIAAELGVAWRRGLLVQPTADHPELRPIYRTGDALADLGCGLVSQVTGLWTGAVVLAGAYAAAFAFAPWRLPEDSLATWIGAFVATDFLYYWWHRASHRVNVLWAAHVVHHQSEDYNLAVALRQAVFTPLTSIPFYFPLAILGVSPLVFLVCLSLNTLYQFWIHTRLVGRLGPFEAVFNTPSHHRVHHGINPKYIDRNHAGVFIVWDRWFFTFEPEADEPVYGVVEGHPSWNPLTAHLSPYGKLFRNAWAAGPVEGMKLCFAPPEWRPTRLGGPVHIPEPARLLRWNPPVSAGVQRYCAAWFLPMAAVLFLMLWYANEAPVALLAVGGTFIVATQLTQTALLESWRKARWMELFRAVWIVPGLAIYAALLWLAWQLSMSFGYGAQ